MEIDSNGRVVKYNIYKSVINSKKRMTYKNANKVLKGEFVEDYDKFKESLIMMADLSKILRKNKLNRGYIDFNIDEPKIIVDEKGTPLDIVLRERDLGEKLIEDLMIITNETVAEYIFNLDYPFIYRVHDKPKEEKIKSFLNLLNSLGYKLKGKVKNITPKFIQGILDMVKDTKDASVISEVGLRSMQKAIYSVDNIGHFGLASKCYTHFTAPNRRYPDLTIQTLLDKYLSGEEISNDSIKNIMQNLVYIADHSSSKERDSVECERDVNDMKMAEYMQYHIGEEYNGIIAGIIPSGMFVRLPNLIEGFVPISTLNGYYEFNEKAQMFIGRRSKKRYRLGDELKVRVVQASKETRKIDFMVI
jgi:ribonuclease R